MRHFQLYHTVIKMFEQHKAPLVYDDEFREEVVAASVSSIFRVFPSSPLRINVENEQLLHPSVHFSVRDTENQTFSFAALSFISLPGRVVAKDVCYDATSTPSTCTLFDTDIIDETIVSHSIPHAIRKQEELWRKEQKPVKTFGTTVDEFNDFYLLVN